MLISSYKYALLSIMAMGGLAAAASEVSVKASLDSAQLLMGRTTVLRLEVEKPASMTEGRFTLLERMSGDGRVGVCGDSVEISRPFKADTTVKDQRMRISYSMNVQSFDSGYYRLPQFVYTYGGDSAVSAVLTLKVDPVKLEPDARIFDYKQAEEAEGKSIFDHVPQWVLDWWWLLAAIVAAIGVFLWGFSRYRKKGYIIPPKPQPTPYEVAVKALANLKARKLWEKGMEKEYFTDLTDILRQYLQGRFGINAMEMTSRQIMATLTDNEELRDKRDYFRQILAMADFVKFAKVRPLPADNVTAFDNAVKFVEETKPVAADEDASDESEGRAGKGGDR